MLMPKSQTSWSQLCNSSTSIILPHMAPQIQLPKQVEVCYMNSH